MTLPEHVRREPKKERAKAGQLFIKNDDFQRKESIPPTSDGQDSPARAGSTRENHAEPALGSLGPVELCREDTHCERPVAQVVICSDMLCIRLSEGKKKASRVSLKGLLEQFSHNA